MRRPSPRSSGPLRYRVVRGPRADGRWYWRASRYGAGVEETVWCGWGTVEEVDLVVAGLVRGDAPIQDAGIGTVSDLLSYWHGAIEERSDLARGTIRGYGLVAKRVGAVIGDVRVDRVDRATAERLRDVSLRAGQTPRTVRLGLMVLEIAWRWGRELGHVERELPRVRVVLPEIRRQAVTDRDAASAIERITSPATRLHLRLLWETGCRPFEIASLRRRDVDGRWLTVTGKRRTRRVPLSLEVAGELAAWLSAHPGDPDGWVLGRMPSSSVVMLRQHLRAAGVTWTPRGLRDAAVRRVYRSGVDPGVAGRLLGHSAVVALHHYRQVTEDELLEAVDRPPAEPARRATISRRRTRPRR